MPEDLAALLLRLRQSDKFVDLGRYNDADSAALLFAFR